MKQRIHGPASARLAAYVQRGEPDECWEWMGTRDHRGYGESRINRKRHAAHRMAWEAVNGPVPEGMGVLHRCDNPPCCNPAHLFVGDQVANMRDARAKGRTGGFAAENAAKTHCVNGHEYTPENTKLLRGGRRDCWTCQRERQAAYRLRRAAS